MIRIPTEEQQQAIQEFSRDILLFAGAGTGKTFTIARKVSVALNHGYEAKDILCLTFTAKAAKEMREDISAETQGAEVSVFTIHGFCYQLLKETARKQAVFSSPSVCDREDAEKLLRSVVLREMDEIYTRSLLKKNGFDETTLATADAVKAEESEEWYWRVNQNGQTMLLSQRGELFDESMIHAANRWDCPFCGIEMECGNVCPKCGGDVRTNITPRLCPKNSLYSLVSAIRHQREYYGIHTSSDKTDYNATVKRLQEKSPETLRKLYFSEGKDKTEDVIFRSATQNWIGDIIVYYERVLRARNLIDFDDMILQTLQLLEDTAVSSAYRERYKLLIVDEAQDTSRLEYKVICHLFGQDTRIMFCGDFYQSIYGWRGAEPNIIETEFVKERNALILNLGKNLRSKSSLSYAADYYLAAAFGHVLPTAPCELECAVEIHSSLTPELQLEWVYRTISGMTLAERGASCVMARTNKALETAVEGFVTLLDKYSEKIEFYRTDEDSRLMRQPIVKDSMAFLKLLLNSSDTDSFERLLTVCMGVSASVLRGVRSKSASGIAVTDFLCDVTRDYYSDLIDAQRLDRCVVFDLETTGLSLARDEAIQIAAKKGSRTFMRYIMPSCPVSPAAQNAHGITVEYLMTHGESKCEVLSAFATFVDGCVLVGHNSNGFDIQMLKRLFAEENIPFPSILGHFDTMCMAKRFYTKISNYKLQTLCEHFGIVNEKAHDALSDVVATEKVLRAMMPDILATASDRTAYYARHRNQYVAIRSDYIDWTSRLENGESCAEIFFDFRDKYMHLNKENEAALKMFEKMLNQTSGESPYAAMETVATAVFDGESEWTEAERQKGKVPCLTVHQSKGCEFGTVFLIDADDGNFPSYYAAKEGNFEEEKRVFYVALTRAKEKMIFVYPQSRFQAKYGKRYQSRPSRFFQFLPKEVIVES